jgi:hypothetical protein
MVPGSVKSRESTVESQKRSLWDSISEPSYRGEGGCQACRHQTKSPPPRLRRYSPKPQSTVCLSRSAASVSPPPSRWGRWPAGQRGPPEAKPSHGAAPSADSRHRSRHRRRANPRLPHFVVETKNRPPSHPFREPPDRMKHRPCPAFGSPRVPRPRIQVWGEETSRAPARVATQRNCAPRGGNGSVLASCDSLSRRFAPWGRG